MEEGGGRREEGGGRREEGGGRREEGGGRRKVESEEGDGEWGRSREGGREGRRIGRGRGGN
jgi:ribonuclease E